MKTKKRYPVIDYYSGKPLWYRVEVWRKGVCILKRAVGLQWRNP